MANDVEDPRMTTIHPRIRYNTIGGVNGPLVILENVKKLSLSRMPMLKMLRLGQIPPLQ